MFRENWERWLIIGQSIAVLFLLTLFLLGISAFEDGSIGQLDLNPNYLVIILVPLIILSPLIGYLIFNLGTYLIETLLFKVESVLIYFGTNNFGNINFYKYFLPNRFREEVEGDIKETIKRMYRSGCSKTHVKIVVTFQLILVALSLFRIKVADWRSGENDDIKPNVR